MIDKQMHTRFKNYTSNIHHVQNENGTALYMQGRNKWGSAAHGKQTSKNQRDQLIKSKLDNDNLWDA